MCPQSILQSCRRSFLFLWQSINFFDEEDSRIGVADRCDKTTTVSAGAGGGGMTTVSIYFRRVTEKRKMSKRSYSFIGSLSLNMFLSFSIKSKTMTNECIQLFNTLSTFVHMSFNKSRVLFGIVLNKYEHNFWRSAIEEKLTAASFKDNISTKLSSCHLDKTRQMWRNRVGMTTIIGTRRRKVGQTHEHNSMRIDDAIVCQFLLFIIFWRNSGQIHQKN